MSTLTPDTYWTLTPIYIAGIDRVGELYAGGQIEEARDHFISCARAVWTGRWSSVRHYSLKRLGGALDVERFPALTEIAAALRAEAPESAAEFLRYLRNRTTPDTAGYVHTPDGTMDVGLWANSLALWQKATGSGDPTWQARLAERISDYLHPTQVISWHETIFIYCALVFSALQHGGIDDETLCKLILFGLDYAEHCNLMAHLSDPPQTSIGGNHIFAMINPWLETMTLFPEFRRAPILQRAAIARLDDEFSKQIMPDGSMIEGAPGYQNCVIFGTSLQLDFCRRYGITLPETTLANIKRMVDFAITLQKPNGCSPMFGDSQDEDAAGYMRAMRPFFPDDPALTWTITHGEEGAPPPHTSVAHPNIGYYALRSGWDKDARYLIFDGGRFGQAHQHEDMLNFEVFAYGHPVIVDAGVRSYEDHWFRTWSVLSQAHNTIDIDGVGQCRWRQDRTLWFDTTPLDNRFETGETWDIVEAIFDGPYEREIGPITQRRRIVFHRGEPNFWVITDTIDGPGEHEVTERFHFAHDLELETRGNAIRTRRPGGPDFALITLTGNGLIASYHRGEQDPPCGWISPCLHTVEPAWEMHVTGTGPLPMRRDFLLLPWPTELPKVTCSFVTKTQQLVLNVGSERYRFLLPE